jgi:hypothetical protein
MGDAAIPNRGRLALILLARKPRFTDSRNDTTATPQPNPKMATPWPSPSGWPTHRNCLDPFDGCRMPSCLFVCLLHIYRFPKEIGIVRMLLLMNLVISVGIGVSACHKIARSQRLAALQIIQATPQLVFRTIFFILKNFCKLTSHLLCA